MKAGTSTRLLRLFGTGVIDQIMLSGASFVAGFVMIRFTSDIAYGQFVLAQSAVLLLVSAQGAWLSGPVTAIAPRKSAEGKRAMVGTLGVSQTRFLRRLAPALLLIPAAGFALSFWSLMVALAAAATILAGWAALQREYLRGVLLIYSRPQAVLQADVVYVLVLLAGIAIALWSRNTAGPWTIGVLALAAAAGSLAAHRLVAADPGWVSGEDARPYWREIRSLGLWSAVGAVIYWLFAQSYNYVLATRLNLTAVTNVNAARLVLMPVFVFTLGINNLLTPAAANWLAESGLPRMLRRLAVLALVVSLVDLCYFTVAWNVRHWLISDLMHKIIQDQDRLLIFWACIAVIFLLREVLQAALFALKRVKSMAWLIALSAAVSLALMWRGIAWWGAAAVLIGQVAGECVNLAGLTWLLWRQVYLQK
jgi:O-antigen/teichoic acid export membrane protein